MMCGAGEGRCLRAPASEMGWERYLKDVAHSRWLTVPSNQPNLSSVRIAKKFLYA